MKSLLKILGLFIILISYSCSTIRTTYDYDKSVNFTSYKTYQIHKKGIDELKLNDLDKRRITSELINELNLKGLVYDENKADLIINVSALSKERTDVIQPIGWGFGWGWGWNPWMWGGMGQTWVNQYEEGSLTFDVVDAQKNILIWQGTSKGILVENLKQKDKQIAEAVQKAFKNFPPKK